MVGVSPLYSGIAPYSSDSDCRTVPSSLTNITVNFFFSKTAVTVTLSTGITKALSVTVITLSFESLTVRLLSL